MALKTAKKGQPSLEYLIIAGLFVTIIVTGFFFMTERLKKTEESFNKAELARFSTELVKKASELYYSGKYGKKTIYFKMPKSITKLKSECKNSIVFYSYDTNEEIPVYIVHSRVPIYIVGFENKTKMPTKFILIKNSNTNYTLICSEDSCNSMFCDSSMKKILYADNDNDGYGNAETEKLSCIQLYGYADNCLDCNDNNSSISPAAAELCDGIDNNCNGIIDEGC